MIISTYTLKDFELHNPDLFDTEEKTRHTVKVLERLLDSQTHIGAYKRDDLRGQITSMRCK